jgi:sRNA-binding carbon storage regulator CsrA
MLVLARKNKESVVIAASDNSHELVRVTVVDICEGRVKSVSKRKEAYRFIAKRFGSVFAPKTTRLFRYGS